VAFCSSTQVRKLTAAVRLAELKQQQTQRRQLRLQISSSQRLHGWLG
jgi:hypothetical protein